MALGLDSHETLPATRFQRTITDWPVRTSRRAEKSLKLRACISRKKGGGGIEKPREERALEGKRGGRKGKFKHGKEALA